MTDVELAHDDTGGDHPPMVLIHGGYGDRTVYRNQVTYFEPTRRVVTLDLRGHGESEKPDQPYTIAGFADDVALLCRILGISSAEAVGHSMGGVVAVELAHRHPDLVRAIATLDSPSIIPGWTARHMGPYSADIQGEDFRQVLRNFLDVASSPADDPDRKAAALGGIEAVPRHVVRAVWDAMQDWDPVPALESLHIPLLYLDHGQPDLEYGLLRRHCPQLVTGQTVGAGHRALQEVPEQVNAMLDRFFSHAELLADHAIRTNGSFRYRHK
jgi:pimeloyl-ACP methyl ester carboxylesterase